MSLAALPTPTPEALAARLARLQAEIQSLCRTQAADLIAAAHALAQAAEDVAGNPSQPPGIRDIARRLCEDLPAKAATIESINQRSAR
jgi:hypothetical protein